MKLKICSLFGVGILRQSCRGLFGSLVTLFFLASWAGAEDSVCATVKIEIEQELSLERQAFEARMTITNGVSNPLENVAVNVLFTDLEGNPVLASSDPNNTEAKFFIRPIGTPLSRIAASEVARLSWLIIPAPGAANTRPSGERYQVGAELTYRVAGLDEKVNVAPDTILIKPMPELELDYFLPERVVGDNPFTPQREAPIPFPMGVRVKNVGAGTASQVRIDSGQPTIVENEQGLYVDFRIQGSEVNGGSVQPTFLVNFGDISGGRSAVARWVMTSTLDGVFTKFGATFAHSDELGGELTSLMKATRAHLLWHDVLVDLPGRDTVRDFLVRAGNDFRVYESETTGVDSMATADQSAVATLSGTGTDSYRLTVGTVSAGFLYARVTDPNVGARLLAKVTRSDGKVISPANAWLSVDFDRNSAHARLYYLNLFDASNTSGMTYQVQYGGTPNRPPEINPVADRMIRPGTLLSVPLSATDPDGTTPEISMNFLPDGAIFAGSGAAGTLTWTPTAAQIGRYAFRVMATDGILSSSRSFSVTVTDQTLYAAWKDRYWPGVTDPGVIGAGADPDRDGLSNLLEYALGLDPTKADPGSGVEIGIDVVGEKRYMTLTYVKRTDDPALVFAVVGSDRARAAETDWAPQSQGVAVGQEGVPAGMERVKVRDGISIEEGPVRRYLKLRVTGGG